MVSYGQINTDRVMAIGRNALYFEDYVLSIQYFNEVIGVKPYLAEPYMYRSIAKVYLDDFVGAEKDATECIERNPFLIAAWEVRGLSRQNLQDYDGSIADFKHGLTMQPENRAFIRYLAISYALKKDYQKADSCFEILVNIAPKEPQGHLNRAILHLEMGDSITALQDLTRVTELDKGNSTAYAMRGMLYEQQGDHKKALSDIDYAIHLDPNQASYYNNRALVRYYTNDLRGAMSDYDQAIELDPQQVLSHFNRGILRAQIGDRNRAIEDFSTVLDIEPKNTFAAYNRAILRDEVGDLEGAISDYRLVFDQHPNFFPALYAMSEDMKRLGRNKEAEDEYKHAFAVQQRVKNKQAAASGSDASSSDLASAPDSTSASDSTANTHPEDEDVDISKFTRIMANANDDRANKYSSGTRGRIQNKNFVVDMQPMFILTYYERQDGLHQNIYFERTLSDFNRAGLLPQRLKVVCQDPMLSQAQVNAHFASIDDYSKLIGISGGTLINFFGRSIDYMLVHDYAQAISDLNQVIFRKDNFILAYFNRSVIRMRQLESEENEEVNYGQTSTSQTVLGFGAAGSSAKTSRNPQSASSTLATMRHKVEFEFCMRDLDKVIELSPTFVYAYYNRAYISSKLGNFDSALEDLDKSIELHPNFAEAYYNRALILLRMGKKRQAIQDLSKAGELGLAQAYSVMKRASE